jgi:hypothetical protein
MNRLKAKRCLITGGTTGIGLETASDESQFTVGADILIDGGLSL